MSIDELLGMPVEELEKLTDEELLVRYAPIFKLEPDFPVEVEVPASSEEAVVTTTVKKAKRAEAKTKIADLKKKLMEASRQGMSADELFEKDFGV